MHALYATQLLLGHLSDILLQRRRFRPGICRPDREGRGRNRWILLNRKGLKRQYPGQNDAKRHDPSKNRPVDEETRSHPLGLTFLLRLGATLGRRLRLGDSDRLARLQLLQARYDDRSEEHTSETPVPHAHLVCRLLLEKKKHSP